MAREVEKIISLSREIVDIELRKDANALEQYIADDYLGVDPSGALINKNICVGRYGREDFLLYEHGILDISVIVFSDTALEIGVMKFRGRLGEFEFGGRYRYSHFWHRTQGNWKLHASQLTPILRE